jgi:hypothetical protein
MKRIPTVFPWSKLHYHIFQFYFVNEQKGGGVNPPPSSNVAKPPVNCMNYCHNGLHLEATSDIIVDPLGMPIPTSDVQANNSLFFWALEKGAHLFPDTCYPRINICTYVCVSACVCVEEWIGSPANLLNLTPGYWTLRIHEIVLSIPIREKKTNEPNDSLKSIGSESILTLDFITTKN